jgi:hypothetical protein
MQNTSFKKPHKHFLLKWRQLATQRLLLANLPTSRISTACSQCVLRSIGQCVTIISRSTITILLHKDVICSKNWNCIHFNVLKNKFFHLHFFIKKIGTHLICMSQKYLLRLVRYNYFQTLYIYIYLVPWGGVRLSPFGTSATIWPIVPAPDDDDDDDDDDEGGAGGGIRIGRGHRNTRIKPAPVPFCPPQIPYDLTWARTRAAVVGIRRLTAQSNQIIK